MHGAYNGLTHLAALRQVVHRNLSYAMIVEDDVILSPEWVRALQHEPNGLAAVLPALLDPKCDVLVTGVCWGLHSKPEWPRRMVRLGRLSVQIARLPRDHQASRCSHGYVVTARGAQKYLRVRTLSRPIDHFMNSFHKEARVCTDWLEPPMFHQTHSINHNPQKGVWNANTRQQGFGPRLPQQQPQETKDVTRAPRSNPAAFREHQPKRGGSSAQGPLAKSFQAGRVMRPIHNWVQKSKLKR